MGSSPRAAGIEGFHLKPKLKPANEVSGVWQRDACFLTLRMRHTAPHCAAQSPCTIAPHVLDTSHRYDVDAHCGHPADCGRFLHAAAA